MSWHNSISSFTAFSPRLLSTSAGMLSIPSVLLLFISLMAARTSSVVVLLPIPKQTKESARRDVIYCVALCGCGPYVSIVWLWTICFYCVGLGHMFLLCV